VNVSDTGIGIDKSKLDIIFEDFMQAEMNTTRKYGGTGLGLSIVKKLVELHNGRIEINSQKNKGTEITCHLPYLTGDENQLAAEYDPLAVIPEEIRKLKILIVDDEEYNRQLFKTILGRWNVKYQEAADGMEAIELVKTEIYDLIFMDVQMPGLDGLKTTKFIRNELQKPAKEMPVIAISAACTTEDLKKYETAGMNAFLSKPFTEEMLLNTILSVIKPEMKDTMPEKEMTVPTEPSGYGQLNLGDLYHLAGNDPAFVRQMLEKFIDSTTKGMEDLNNALNSGKWEQVADAAHKISPPCRHIGALTLLGYLKQIESNARDRSNLDTLKKLAGQSAQEFETVQRIIQEELANIS
jgi:CheY-like chemotaxis protein